jgi:apolipoprotein N-acyltransferase
MEKDRKKTLALSAAAAMLSVVLLFIAFPPVDLGILVLVAFVPWLLSLEDRSARWVFLVAAVSGFLFSMASLSWIATVTVAGLVITALYMALFFVVRGLGLLALRRLYRLPLALCAPLVFVTAELLQSFVFTGFPWLFAGHALYRQKVLIQIADLAGSYGATALALAVNGALADVWLAWRGREDPRKATFAGIGAALFLLFVLVYGAIRMSPGEETGPEVLIVQGNIPQEVKDSGKPRLLQDIWETYLRLTFEGAAEKADLIIWPETMVPRSISTDTEKLEGVIEIAERLDMDFLVGSVRVDPLEEGPLGDYNSAMLVRKDGVLDGHYSKIHRVPGGEYVPFRRLFPALEPILMSMFGYLPDVAPGRTLTCLEMTDRNGVKWKFGNLICFEAIFPELARPQVRDGARFIVNVTNEGWFGDRGEQEQIQAISCFRAVEYRLTVVRAANTGITALIGPDGEVYDVFERDGKQENVEGTFRGRIRLDGRWTLYGTVGDLFAWLAALATFALWIAGWIRTRRGGGPDAGPGEIDEGGNPHSSP